MTVLTLSDERREQLAGLLANDGAALRVNHPQVADYLETASQLARSANPEIDQALDLAILHYMTGGESDNPYWDIVVTALGPGTTGNHHEVNGGSPHGSARLRYAENLLQAAYAYPITSPQTLRWAAAAAGGRPVIEIGAGRGYWAFQLARHDITIRAYDVNPPGERLNNSWFPPVAGLPDQWHHVGGLRELVVATRVVRDHGGSTDHVLLLCWPPAWDHPMAYNAVVAYERLGGDRLIYIGEPRGGTCANDRFFDTLDQRWQLVSESANHITWWNLNDVAQCWERAT